MTRICSLSLIGLLLTFGLFSRVLAGQIGLAWDPNSESDLAGYKIYYGISSRTDVDPKICGLCGYTTVIPVGNVTAYTLSNLLSGQTYYISVTAYDTSNNESGFSNEVSGGATNPIPAQYTLAVNVNGSGSVTKNPDKTSYSTGEQVTLTATAGAGYSFSGWSGDASGTTNPVTLTMNGNKTVTANFVAAGSFELNPSGGLSATGRQGGLFDPSKQTYTLQNRSEKVVKWRVAKKSRWVTASPTNGSLTPGEVAQVIVSIGSGAKLLKPGSYSDTIIFSNTANGNDSSSRSITLAVKPPLKPYTVKTNPEGLQVAVDGVLYTSLYTFDWEVGSSHTLEALSPQTSASGTPYVFSFWSNRKSRNQTLVAPPSDATYVANFKPQHALTAIVSSHEGGVGGINGSDLRNQSNTNLPIVGALESPSDGQRALGLKTIYGWALDGEGVSRVKLLIDGKYICDIPYGGLREDVKEAHPDYPNAERGGFAMVWNYSSLSRGAHFVQIEVQNMKGEALDLNANFIVHKISGGIITQVAPSGWLIPGVNLTVDGNINGYDLLLEWSNDSQAFEIIDLYPQ